MPASPQPTPMPAAAPVDTPAEELGGVFDWEATEGVELPVDADVEMMEVLVAVKPEVIVKYGMRADGAGAAKVSSVGLLHWGLPIASTPQQCHRLVVESQTTSGRARSTRQINHN